MRMQLLFSGLYILITYVHTYVYECAKFCILTVACAHVGVLQEARITCTTLTLCLYKHGCLCICMYIQLCAHTHSCGVFNVHSGHASKCITFRALASHSFTYQPLADLSIRLTSIRFSCSHNFPHCSSLHIQCIISCRYFAVALAKSLPFKMFATLLLFGNNSKFSVSV